MRSQFLVVAAALASISIALPAFNNHIVHEKRSESSSWVPKDGVKPDARIRLPVKIGLTESNLHLGDDILMSISDPASDKYGQHLTTEQVNRMINRFLGRTDGVIDCRSVCTRERVN